MHDAGRGPWDDRPRGLGLVLDDGRGSLPYELVRGEGQVSDRVDKYTNLPYDPVTGLLGPVDLPTNGMMRIWWSVNGVKKTWVLSSYMVTNNEQKPWLNLCEVAATQMP